MKLTELLDEKDNVLNEKFDLESIMNRGLFTPGAGELSGGKHVFFMPDGRSYIEMPDSNTAKSYQAAMESMQARGASSDAIQRALTSGNYPEGVRVNATASNPITTNGDIKAPTRFQRGNLKVDIKETIARKSKPGRLLATLQNQRWFRLLGRVAIAAGLVFASFYGVLNAIEDVEQDIDNGTIDQDEGAEIVNVLKAQLALCLIMSLMVIFRNGALLGKLISYIRPIIRLIAAGATVSVVGTIPGIIALLANEVAWGLVIYALSSPTVQRYAAEFIAGSLLGPVIAEAGKYAGTAMQFLNQASEEMLGVSIRDGDLFGFDQTERGGREGEYYASAEWAKLLFQDMLFPPAQKSMLVPYITPARREGLLEEAFGLTNPTQNQQPPTTQPDATDPNATDTDATSSNSDAVSRKADIERSLQNTDYYNNPSYTRAQPVSGPR